MLAAELRLHDVRVLVLEKETEPESVTTGLRALRRPSGVALYP
jgi:hypothetical protein